MVREARSGADLLVEPVAIDEIPTRLVHQVGKTEDQRLHISIDTNRRGSANSRVGSNRMDMAIDLREGRDPERG